ncbi:MAG: Uncharacterised protein [Cryomorphaceae bacterium]|nr:MAG: Uncharacterised protein [Cryomorphaceae bacterium]
METTLTLTVNNLWMMICTALVFFMHLGFSFFGDWSDAPKKHSEHSL